MTNMQVRKGIETHAESVMTATDSTTPLVVRGVTGQTANLQEWQDEFANTLAYLSANGSFSLINKLHIASSTAAGAMLNIAPGIVPDSPVNGDMWITSDGLFIQNDGITTRINNSETTEADFAISQAMNIY